MAKSRQQLDREIATVLGAPKRKRGRVGTVLGAPKRGRVERRVAYRLQLAPAEVQTVEFARGRYAWPDMLHDHLSKSGLVELTEAEMWQWVEDVDSDDAPFPLASSDLAAKLQDFYDQRV